MKKKTIKEVIIDVLKEQTRALTSNEIYNLISRGKLYDFKSKTPASIINSELRKNSQGIDLKKSSRTKVFRSVEGNKFALV